MSTNYLETPVGILVAERPNRADVFDRFHIDYCCGGKLPLRWYCERKGISPDALLEALGEVEAAPAPPKGFELTLAGLVAHLVGAHHMYLRAVLPRLGDWHAKVAQVHGDAHPELAALSECFKHFSSDMLAHMDQEERVLFPLIIRIERGLDDEALAKRFINQQLATTDAEHTALGMLIERLEAITQGFVAPPDACTTYRALYAGLEAMVADTRRHVHQESSLLFPRVQALIANPPEPTVRYGEQANRGELDFAEKRPADPLKDAATRSLSHEGGLSSARNELY